MPPPSKIIKGADLASDQFVERPLSRPTRPVVNAEVYDAHQKAKEIIEQADRQAASIIERAKQEREASLIAARKKGQQEGLAQASEIILRAKKEASTTINGSEKEIVRLALAVAEKIIGRALELDPKLVLSITAQAIESVRQQRELILRVNPEDAQILRTGRQELMDMLGRTKEIAVREDLEVARGGCIIETENGTIDARLDSQLEMLSLALLGENWSAV